MSRVVPTSVPITVQPKQTPKSTSIQQAFVPIASEPVEDDVRQEPPVEAIQTLKHYSELPRSTYCCVYFSSALKLLGCTCPYYIPSPLSQNLDEAFNDDFCQRRQRAIDNIEFRASIAAWSPQLRTLEQLIEYIRLYTDPLDRTWVTFYWIATNIRYRKWSITSSPQVVFKNKTAIGEGYTTLFEYICNQVGVPCMKITGLAKGAGYSPLISRACWFPVFLRQWTTNHVWNVVQLFGRWYLVDPTWGAGYMNADDRTFAVRLNTHYFLTRPEHFNYTHLPDDSQWQLLPSDRRLSFIDFINLPKVWSHFFQLDLTIVSPTSADKLAFNPQRSLAELYIRSPDNVTLSTVVKQNGTDSSSSTETLVQYDHERQAWHLLFAPARHGSYVIRIFGSRDYGTGSYAVEYTLHVPVWSTFRPLTFPNIYLHFNKFKCQLIEPLDGKLTRGSTVTIHCRIFDMQEVYMTFGVERQTDNGYYDSTSGIFKQEIIVPDQNTVTIGAQTQNGTYITLLSYAVII